MPSAQLFQNGMRPPRQKKFLKTFSSCGLFDIPAMCFNVTLHNNLPPLQLYWVISRVLFLSLPPFLFLSLSFSITLTPSLTHKGAGTYIFTQTHAHTHKHKNTQFSQGCFKAPCHSQFLELSWPYQLGGAVEYTDCIFAEG